MEIVSMTKKANLAIPKQKTLSMTSEAVMAVQRKGKTEYAAVMNAVYNLVNTMAGTVLFKEVNGMVGQQLKEAFDIRLSLLDPTVPLEDKNPVFVKQVKNAQRKLFLAFSRKYGLDGIKEDD